MTRISLSTSPKWSRPRPWLALISLLVAAFCALAAPPVHADGIIIPVPPPNRPIPWREIPLTIKYHRVKVAISDQIATTHVDQVFVNEASFPVEGTYIFPLPEDAAIASFDMWVDGQKLEGKLLGKQEARAIYEEIVRQQRDPALLEYVGRGAFRASIFPIPPRGERRIELTYSQVLPAAEGLVRYRYPLNTEKFSARLISQVAVTVNIEDKLPLAAIYSPSHAVDVSRDGDHRATVSFEARNVRPDRDFDLFYSRRAARPGAPDVNLLSHKPFDEDGYFLLLVTPPIEPTGQIVAKDVVLVLDVSGSMEGEKLSQAKAAAVYVLEHLAADDRFNIVAFSSATRLFAERPAAASRRGEGREFVQRLTAQGSTNIQRALLEALAGADAQRPTVLIFLTDGLPTAGETVPDRIVASVGQSAAKSVRLFAFGVGYDVDTMLLDQLSSNHRGSSVYVRPNQKIDEEVSGFYARVSAPVLVDVGMAFSGVTVEDIYPYPLPDLFVGTQLVVAGRYRQGGVVNLKLTGSVNGRPQTYTFSELSFANRGGDEFIPRLWAQRKVGYLLAQIRLHGPKDELVKEVIALSTRHGIVTPYTSFLVLEPNLALTQPGRDELSRRVQTPMPAATPAPAVGGTPGKVGAPTKAPEAPAALAPTVRSGEQAVERAVVEKELARSDVAASPSATQVKQVGDKTFILHNGVWTDTAFDATRLKTEPIAFGSERYFQLLSQHAEIGRYLALGDRVTVVLAGRVYAVGPEGQTSPAATPVGPASPTPVPARPATATAIVHATAATAASPTISTQPVATSEPAQPPVAGPALCPGAAAVGLLGIALPVWVGRRRRG